MTARKSKKKISKENSHDLTFNFKRVLMQVALFGLILAFALLISRIGVEKLDSNRIGNAYMVSDQTTDLVSLPSTDTNDALWDYLTIRKFLRSASTYPSQYIIVIGRKAPATEVARAAEFAAILKISQTKFDDEVNNAQLTNAIIIGTPASNKLISDSYLDYDSKAELNGNYKLVVGAKSTVDEIINFLKTYNTNPNTALDTKCLKGTGNQFRKCQDPLCGNNIVELGEQCDTNSTKVCTDFESLVAWPNPKGTVVCRNCIWDLSICSAPVAFCGNGKQEASEACDDGNLLDDDGCSAKCQKEVYFVYETSPYLDKAVFKLVDPSKIELARNIISGKENRTIHVLGNATRGTKSYNMGYHFYLQPESIDFFEVSVEVCDASLNYIEQIYSGGGTFLNGRWCPWASKLLKETVPPTPICWNNYLENGEYCDGRKNITCGDFDKLGPWKNPSTSILCDEKCNPDLRLCIRKTTCGNGINEPGEECEVGQTTMCYMLSNSTSNPNTIVTCSISCQYNKSQCNLPPGTCYDSDGYNMSSYYTKGNVTGLYPNGTGYVFNDYCSGNRNVEYYCGTSQPGVFDGYDCPYGCLNGACIGQNLSCASLPAFINSTPDAYMLNYGTPITINQIWVFDSAGALACSFRCTLNHHYDWNSRTCVMNFSGCGDGIININEECDGPGTFNTSCENYGLKSGGPVECRNCQLNLDKCLPSSPVCGDGIIEAGEACDGNTNGFTCSDFGNYTAGELRCVTCAFDLSNCTSGRQIYSVVYEARTQSSSKAKFAMVIGKSASASDSVAAVDLAGFVGIDKTIFDSDAAIVTDKSSRIIIGGPCVNSEASKLLGIAMNKPECYERFPVGPGKAIIATITESGFENIIVAGYSAEDTRRAGRILVENLDELKTSYEIV